MKDSSKSRNNTRLFLSEPDSVEVVPPVCRACGSDLILHQPDPEMPERLLGTCGGCKSWYLIEGDLECLQVAAGETEQGEVCLPNSSPVLPYALRSLNGHA